MRVISRGLVVSALALVGPPLHAQPGAGSGAGRAPVGAEFFLARTGELRLTDAQVVRLAAIARRSADRRRAMRASLDSAAGPMRSGVRADSAARAARARTFDQMRARFERDREQDRADLRDALQVLTAEQQAIAWEMTARGAGARASRGSRLRADRRRGALRDRVGRNRAPVPGQRPRQ